MEKINIESGAERKFYSIPYELAYKIKEADMELYYCENNDYYMLCKEDDITIVTKYLKTIEKYFQD